MRIDAHQHFWRYDPEQYPWMTSAYANLRRDFLPEDLQPLLTGAGFAGCMAIQSREMTVENQFLLDLARKYSWILGVVGWLDLCAPGARAELERLTEDRRLRGLRMLIHDREDPDFADSPAHARGVGWLGSLGLTYDLLIRPRHLQSAIRLVDRWPNQRFIVDHLAKPEIASGQVSPWREYLIELARRPNVACKLSALVTTASWSTWKSSHFIPYLDIVLAAFGPGRLMIGSDWPVCTCAATYGQAMAAVSQWTESLTASEREQILGRSCADWYGLGVL